MLKVSQEVWRIGKEDHPKEGRDRDDNIDPLSLEGHCVGEISDHEGGIHARNKFQSKKAYRILLA